MQPDRYTLTLTAAQLAVVNAAVVELPYRIAAPLIAEVNAQIAAQRGSEPQNDD